MTTSKKQYTVYRAASTGCAARAIAAPIACVRIESPRVFSMTDWYIGKGGALPDPSQFPDPFPYRSLHQQQHLSSTPPTLSSGASSASTRSSAYTSSGSALASSDYHPVHVASGEDEEAGIGVGITSDDVVQMMAQDTPAASGSQSRLPIDQGRWSLSYSGSIRSRSSLARSNSSSVHENNVGSPTLRPQPSYDLSWQAVDERDEVDLTSGDETEETDLDDDDMEEEERQREQERTSAAVIAEEGRGLIVQGNGISTAQLQVHAGTTHLLVGSSSTPNSIPSFLTSILPQICNTLLALDISANFLGALPPALESCINLEELNVSSNPLRALPLFIANLTSLRVLIADSTGISNLPAPLSALEKLHTLSIRRNKMYSLPSWFCLLPSLEMLLVDGNPFQGPWKALVDPLLSKEPSTPVFPPSTPLFPLASASTRHTQDTDASTDTDVEDLSDPAIEVGFNAPEDEDTITPDRAVLGRAATSPSIPAEPSAPRAIQRTRTTPNRRYFDKNRGENGEQSTVSRGQSQYQSSSRRVPDSGYFGDSDREVRRMKSAGELRRGVAPVPPITASASTSSTPVRPALTHYATSASSSNLLEQASPSLAPAPLPARFASLGVGAGARAAPGTRPPLDRSLWDRISSGDPTGQDASSSPPRRESSAKDHPSGISLKDDPNHLEKLAQRQRSGSRRKEEKDKEKSGRWGFLKKMSMGKIRSDSPSSSRSSTAQGRPSASPLASLDEGSTRSSSTPNMTHGNTGPQANFRLSSADGPLVESPADIPEVSFSPVIVEPEMESLSETREVPPSSPAPGLLSPSTLAPPTSRPAKRRSFLPIDGPPALSIPVPSNSDFLPSLGVTDQDDTEGRGAQTPSPVLAETMEQYQRREQEKAREAYTRSLRSVMAYLRDVNDLSLSQNNTLSIYSQASIDSGGSGTRSRRPTIVEGNRVVSDGSMNSPPSFSGSTDQLRSMESIARLRSLSSSQTASVVTTDSTGSSGGEERKFKDDSGKRAMIVREIVETERTYVKGLQELVDIYIKPAAAPVNLLGGVSSTKETVVPAAERKLVFNGLDSLFSFHRESFLPALEMAAKPLFKPSAVLALEDADGKLSTKVATAVANTFVSHAAFMKMYSTYINNFDNSVQRIKHWTSDRPVGGTSSPPAQMTPSSSAQMIGLGLAISSISTPGMNPDGVPTLNGVGALSSSQRKRIKSYLKRCRLNPRHSQLNLEGYLLLPVQRIPRYRLLLEELIRSTPPTYDYVDPLDKALAEISSLATNMNEGKRESESRRKLVQWQARIRGRFPSPLVQPHRRLIMDGPLLLTRVVRKATIAFEVINSQGDASNVQVECLSPEQTPRSLVGILCNDLLVLCRDPSEGRDPGCAVDLWAVLRMQTLPQPASIVHGNVLRLVDNKAILYFEASSTSDALTWFRAINLHIPSNKL
ncbi:hypothetical protein EVG20_g6717 [Dentipellis fragilis]|uniref:DH domain-containing protein n=1 Tax=Dentipellis fragilis TaxID=205917 RepID=A0A4Y9YIP6_9AGAM|nr:hypothetical protein EVG20_g6717 [Dentipellis fragilis]